MKKQYNITIIIKAEADLFESFLQEKWAVQWVKKQVNEYS